MGSLCWNIESPGPGDGKSPQSSRPSEVVHMTVEIHEQAGKVGSKVRFEVWLRDLPAA